MKIQKAFTGRTNYNPTKHQKKYTNTKTGKGSLNQFWMTKDPEKSADMFNKSVASDVTGAGTSSGGGSSEGGGVCGENLVEFIDDENTLEEGVIKDLGTGIKGTIKSKVADFKNKNSIIDFAYNVLKANAKNTSSTPKPIIYLTTHQMPISEDELQKDLKTLAMVSIPKVLANVEMVSYGEAFDMDANDLEKIMVPNAIVQYKPSVDFINKVQHRKQSNPGYIEKLESTNKDEKYLYTLYFASILTGWEEQQTEIEQKWNSKNLDRKILNQIDVYVNRAKENLQEKSHNASVDDYSIKVKNALQAGKYVLFFFPKSYLNNIDSSVLKSCVVADLVTKKVENLNRNNEQTQEEDNTNQEVDNADNNVQEGFEDMIDTHMPEYDCEGDKWEIDEPKYWEDIYKQFGFEDTEDSDYEEYQHEYDQQIDYILDDLDNQLDWLVIDGVCSKPALVDKEISIDCDPDIDIVTEVRRIINDVCKDTNSKVTEDGYSTIISFNESLCEGKFGQGNLFYPTQACLNKIKDRMDANGRENVKAITSDEKMYAYYHAAIILGWKELMHQIEELAEMDNGKIPVDKDILEKIRNSENITPSENDQNIPTIDLDGENNIEDEFDDEVVFRKDIY